MEQLLFSEQKGRCVMFLALASEHSAPLDLSQLCRSSCLRLSARPKRLVNQGHVPPASQRQHVLLAQLPGIVGLLLISGDCHNIISIFCCTHCHNSLQNALLLWKREAREQVRLKNGSWDYSFNWVELYKDGVYVMSTTSYGSRDYTKIAAQVFLII
jgi:hypothetical protein